MKTYSWEQISNNKSKLSKLSSQRPIFILGPRNISKKRILELHQQLIKKRPVIWGCLKDDYIPGLEGSPQFKSLDYETLKKSLEDLGVNQGSEKKASKNKTVILRYHFRHTKYILQDLKLSAVIAINGSWHHAFHFTPIFYELTKKKMPYKLVSSFVDEAEAKKYWQQIKDQLPELEVKANQKMDDKKLNDQKLMAVADQAAKKSFDYTFQTGAVLAKSNQFLGAAHNRVVPFPSYALHHGARKEKHFGPPNDLNYFDTNHAEVELLIKAQQQNISLAGTSLYINLLPCPTCARMLARTEIKEIIYQHDHSEGYAYDLLTKSGKVVKRL